MHPYSLSILRTRTRTRTRARTRTRSSLPLPLPLHSHPIASTPSTFALLTILFLPSLPAQACSVCFGAEGDPQTAGMNGAILTLLGVTALVATGLSLIFLRIMRRARRARTAYSRPPSSPADIVTEPVQS